jgi:hypothetical protein
VSPESGGLLNSLAFILPELNPNEAAGAPYE